jgi:tRNA threonylcarbamoyladenosine biosynthesis protein TsaE
MIPYEKNRWHIDLYRLKDEIDILQLGLLDIMAMDCCIIEWPERFGTLLPSRRIDITLSFTDQEDVRSIQVFVPPQSFRES